MAGDIRDIESDLFLEAMHRRWGYDFRDYARASVARRIQRIIVRYKAGSVVELIPRLLRDPDFFGEVLQEFSTTVSEMFRDPDFFKSLRQNVLPYLKTFPFIKVWHAGCSSGEEVYSTAILFREEGLAERTTFFATDFNPLALSKARDGVYALDRMREFTACYQQAGGTAAFSDYYHAGYAGAIMEGFLKQNVTFAEHNLAADGVFSEMHLVCCRNVLIYFNRDLQKKVLNLFCDSLVRGGILALGSKETIRTSGLEHKFKTLDKTWKIYQKI